MRRLVHSGMFEVNLKSTVHARSFMHTAYLRYIYIDLSQELESERYFTFDPSTSHFEVQESIYYPSRHADEDEHD